MLKLIFKLIESLSYPAWIIKNNELIHFNNELSMLFNTKIYAIDHSNNKLKINNTLIQNSSNNCFLINNTQYSLSYISEYINDIHYKIYFLKNNLINLSESSIESNEILKTVIDNIPQLIFFKDTQGIYKIANKPCLDFYSEKGINNIIGKSDSELKLDKNFINTCEKNDKLVIYKRKPVYIEERINSNNTQQIFQTVKTPVIDKNNEFIGIVGVAHDITEQKKFEEDLKHLSYTDSLTGLHNRAYFTKKVNELIKEEAFPIRIIMGDVNGLKMVNDTFGHIEGDNLIIAMSNRLKSLYNNDLIFRWGGDEFILLVPNCNSCVECDLMRKITTIDNSSLNLNFTLSMSIGSSIIKNKYDNLDDALKDAENELYSHKLLVGKNVRISILTNLIKTLHVKNIENIEHIDRVIDLCLKLGKKLNLSLETLDELALIAKLHDIGKIAISEEILLKPETLSYEEFEIMKTHSEKGYRLLMTIPELNHIAKGILSHHENYDGSGYPLGLSKNEIPLISRIFSIVDAYDTMTNNSLYNKTKTKLEAIAELKKCSGTQFDPKIVELFCSIL
ncbi:MULTISPECIES: HD domain-containing phosphohydrolase [unclassified Clostridium]|uniref:sensor domain-containing diguanylate cyclase/phosphohydrolase n=1 Tax=Clostridium TaxID=1485 RepID=UPI001C8B4978|nr:MULTISPECIES: HD domain-containing phosphohydrolase [unclassified Clostridium]MBX9137119.1 diguanylate cyclase [Clostridium sp. K12(2020)]MBX9144030.1 diguanylate cyclase [Clostridium sp. K13]